jgi:hypothetical protein
MRPTIDSRKYVLFEVLSQDEWLVANEPQRLQRLRELATF